MKFKIASTVRDGHFVSMRKIKPDTILFVRCSSRNKPIGVYVSERVIAGIMLKTGEHKVFDIPPMIQTYGPAICRVGG